MKREKFLLGALGSAVGIVLATGGLVSPAMAVSLATEPDALEYVIGEESAACVIGTNSDETVTVASAGSNLLDVTFDLTRVPAGVNAVRVPTLIAKGCSNWIHTVTFVGSPEITDLVVEPDAFHQNLWGNSLVSVVFPEGVENLDLQGRSFYQYAWGVDNALTEVVFPSTVKTMHIGDGAFSQGRVDQSDGDNTLKRIEFPEGLESLVIDQYGFYQISGQNLANTNALSEIKFPSTLKNLEIGYRAFSQWSNGGPNALESVYFPDGLERLILGTDAFYQSKNDQNKLRRVSIPGDLKQLTIGSGAFTSPTLPVVLEFRTAKVPGEAASSVALFQQIVAPNGRLFWWGDTSRTSEVWGGNLVPGSTNYNIAGYRQLDFELDGGQLDEFAGSESRFAYPEGEGHVASWSGIAEYTGVSPAWPFGRHWVTLPEPTKTNHTFLGWCESKPQGEVCKDSSGATADMLTAASEYDLEDTAGEIPVLYAVWRAAVVPPKLSTPIAPALTAVACDVAPEVAIPTREGVLYEQRRKGKTVTVTAKPADGYEFKAGAVSTWSFDVTVTPCKNPVKPPTKGSPATETTLAATGASGSEFPIALLGIAAGVLLLSLRRRRSLLATS
ncbi:leucine-rich repeat domain-containing protein [Leucobacter viscericola]|uniref:Leucine-rich repeat domain-containing protein n=1 Tax=Leucobacter viscericola TaxID=2714935 RepID=A0A6G7XIG1_9MICO|nr:leucine-rich repeat domain-containing protein [Leucobacter viscericola]QIK64355.1 leucine-rich repeat domain-containing protein [Leucobacter viscericola]